MVVDEVVFPNVTFNAGNFIPVNRFSMGLSDLVNAISLPVKNLVQNEKGNGLAVLPVLEVRLAFSRCQKPFESLVHFNDQKGSQAHCENEYPVLWLE